MKKPTAPKAPSKNPPRPIDREKLERVTGGATMVEYALLIIA